jgi:hypothetical protein
VLAYGPAAEWLVENKLIPKMRQRLGESLVVGSVSVDSGTVVMRNVVVGGDENTPPIAEIAEIVVEISPWDALSENVEVEEVLIRGAKISASKGASDNVSNFLDRLRSRRSDEGGQGTGGGRRVTVGKLVVESGTFVATDSNKGLEVRAASLSGEVTRGEAAQMQLNEITVTGPAGVTLSAAGVGLTFELARPVQSAVAVLEGGSFAPSKHLSLTGIEGNIAAGERSDVLEIDLRGSYGGADEVLWHAEGTLDVAGKYVVLDAKAEKFTLGRIRSILEGSALHRFDDTTVGANVHVEVSPGLVAVDGELEVAGLNVFHPMLAEKPVEGVAFRSVVSAEVEPPTRTLRLRRAALDLGGVTYELSGEAKAPRPGSEEKAKLSARLLIPEVSCQEMLDSLPPQFIPYMRGFKLGGKFAAKIDLAIDWADLESTVLDGSVGIRNCKVRKPGQGMDAKRFKQSFEHFVEQDNGKWISFVVGSSNPDFVPYYDVSPHLVNSLITTEDSRFFRHKGFIVREFRTALIKDLEAGYFKYGASSITMQTVKNVILYREKTLARKFQELFFTWYLETVLDKERIMEIYLNAIEYGPGVYGIGPASRMYFGKHPRDLNPVESAFFSSILPNPKKRYLQFCDGQLTRWTSGKIARILGLMHKRARLTDDEYMLATQTPLVFNIPPDDDVKKCKRRARRFMRKKKSNETNPRKR